MIPSRWSALHPIRISSSISDDTSASTVVVLPSYWTSKVVVPSHLIGPLLAFLIPFFFEVSMTMQLLSAISFPTIVWEHPVSGTTSNSNFRPLLIRKAIRQMGVASQSSSAFIFFTRLHTTLAALASTFLLGPGVCDL